MKITDNKKAVGIITAQEGRDDNYPALDYDDCKEKIVKEDAKRLMNKFKLGDFNIAKTGHRHYHVIFPYEMLNWEEILEILEYSNFADKEFIRYKRRDGFLRIRVCGKGKNPPKIVDVVKSPYPNMNEVMGNFRKKHYGMLIRKLGRKHG